MVCAACPRRDLRAAWQTAASEWRPLLIKHSISNFQVSKVTSTFDNLSPENVWSRGMATYVGWLNSAWEVTKLVLSSPFRSSDPSGEDSFGDVTNSSFWATGILPFAERCSTVQSSRSPTDPVIGLALISSSNVLNPAKYFSEKDVLNFHMHITMVRKCKAKRQISPTWMRHNHCAAATTNANPFVPDYLT